MGLSGTRSGFAVRETPRVAEATRRDRATPFLLAETPFPLSTRKGGRNATAGGRKRDEVVRSMGILVCSSKLYSGWCRRIYYIHLSPSRVRNFPTPSRFCASWRKLQASATKLASLQPRRRPRHHQPPSTPADSVSIRSLVRSLIIRPANSPCLSWIIN